MTRRIAVAFCAALVFLAVAAAAEIVNRVAAVVDDEIVTVYEVEKEAQRAVLMLREQNGWTAEQAQEQLPAVKQQILDNVIREKLFEHEVAKIGVPVSESDIDNYLDFIAKKSGVTMAQLSEMIRREGQTMAEYRELVKKKIQREQYVQFRLQGGATNVSDEEIRNYYNLHKTEFVSEAEVHLREMRFVAGAGDPAAKQAEAKERAQAAYEKLLAGRSFADLAQQVSDSPSGRSGGDLGWFKLDTELKPTYARVARTLEPGGFSGVALDGDSYFLLQLESIRGNEPRPLEEVRDRIKNVLFNQKVDRQIEMLTDELYQKSYVDVRVTFVEEDGIE